VTTLLKVIDGKASDKPYCAIRMDNEMHKCEEFVAVLYHPDSGFEIAHYTDTVGLGVALQLISKAFKDSYAGLGDEEKQLVDNFFMGVGKP